MNHGGTLLIGVAVSWQPQLIRVPKTRCLLRSDVVTGDTGPPLAPISLPERASARGPLDQRPDARRDFPDCARIMVGDIQAGVTNRTFRTKGQESPRSVSNSSDAPLQVGGAREKGELRK
jgi:hypothetical protein